MRGKPQSMARSAEPHWDVTCVPSDNPLRGSSSSGSDKIRKPRDQTSQLERPEIAGSP